MLQVSNTIKNAYNQYTTQRKSYIQVGQNQYFIQNMDLYADSYDEGNIVGNAIAKILKFDIETQYVRGLDEFVLYDGIWTGSQYEYINLGTFKLFEEQGKDGYFSSITAYDKLLLFNVPFDKAIEYPTTIYGLLQNICEQAGVTLATSSIANGDKVLDHNLFEEGETLKDILRAICQISGTFAVISQDTLKLKLVGEDTLQLSNYQISDPEYKRTTWKINQVVLGMTDIAGEYVQKQDDEDVERNGVHKIVINDNPFTYTQELRQEYIDDLFDALYGFGYVAFETKWEGLPYVELGDQLNINGYNSLVLRYEITSPNGLSSMLQAPSIIDSVIDYYDNTNDLENKMRKTEYKVDKAEGTISQLTSLTTEFGNRLASDYYTITQTNLAIQTAQTGLTNTFSEAGGNNIFRNTGLWFENSGEEAQTNPYEFWNGLVVRAKEDKASNSNAMLLQDATLSQEQIVPNGTYTISFKYKTLIPTTVASIEINDVSYSLEADTDTEFVQVVEITSQHIKLEFLCETNGGCEIYDLMVNAGSVKLAYSQNQNETTTDTVNISKGITITSSDTDTTFKANADGIRTLDNSGNELAVFTDRGMKTKEMIVENQATICNTLIQDINNQTWFTRL